jgi:hypothetical protein
VVAGAAAAVLGAVNAHATAKATRQKQVSGSRSRSIISSRYSSNIINTKSGRKKNNISATCISPAILEVAVTFAYWGVNVTATAKIAGL